MPFPARQPAGKGEKGRGSLFDHPKHAPCLACTNKYTTLRPHKLEMPSGDRWTRRLMTSQLFPSGPHNNSNKIGDPISRGLYFVAKAARQARRLPILHSILFLFLNSLGLLVYPFLTTTTDNIHHHLHGQARDQPRGKKKEKKATQKRSPNLFEAGVLRGRATGLRARGLSSTICPFFFLPFPRTGSADRAEHRGPLSGDQQHAPRAQGLRIESSRPGAVGWANRSGPRELMTVLLALDRHPRFSSRLLSRLAR